MSLAHAHAHTHTHKDDDLLTWLGLAEITTRTLMAARYQLHVSEVRALIALAAGERRAGRALKGGEVGRLAGLHYKNAYHSCNAMVKAGLAVRAGRFGYHLTDAGRAIAADYERERQAHLQKCAELLALPGGAANLAHPDWL